MNFTWIMWLLDCNFDSFVLSLENNSEPTRAQHVPGPPSPVRFVRDVGEVQSPAMRLALRSCDFGNLHTMLELHLQFFYRLHGVHSLNGESKPKNLYGVIKIPFSTLYLCLDLSSSTEYSVINQVCTRSLSAMLDNNICHILETRVQSVESWYNMECTKSFSPDFMQLGLNSLRLLSKIAQRVLVLGCLLGFFPHNFDGTKYQR
mmetsp:Transcript_17847/g.35875  ORF Transcript_17847/g.35875 Transcript_17847/m.35875 type:complete len:204 (+) Transcript_17847:875-1486(+)